MANLLLEMTQVLDNTVYSKSEEMGTVCASGQAAPSNNYSYKHRTGSGWGHAVPLWTRTKNWNIL